MSASKSTELPDPKIGETTRGDQDPSETKDDDDDEDRYIRPYPKYEEGDDDLFDDDEETTPRVKENRWRT